MQQERAEWYRRARQRATVQRCCLRQGLIISLLIRYTLQFFIVYVYVSWKSKSYLGQSAPFYSSQVEELAEKWSHLWLLRTRFQCSISNLKDWARLKTPAIWTELLDGVACFQICMFCNYTTGCRERGTTPCAKSVRENVQTCCLLAINKTSTVDNKQNYNLNINNLSCS